MMNLLKLIRQCSMLIAERYNKSKTNQNHNNILIYNKVNKICYGGPLPWRLLRQRQ